MPRTSRPRTALPPGLAGRPFLLASGAEAGLGRGRLVGPDLARPTSGVRSAVPLTSVTERAWAYSLVLPPDVAFSGITAAAIWDLWLPWRLQRLGPLHVSRTSDRTRIRRAGVVGHRGLETCAVDRVRGLRVVDLADTWCDLAAVATVDELVVLGDCVAARLGSVEPLTARLRDRPRLPGRERLRRALPEVRTGSRSPKETEARLLLTRAGLPEPELNAPVHDEHGGWLGEGDLVWAGPRVIGEYQGEAAHAGFRRRALDSRRAALFVDRGWKVVEVFADDLAIPALSHGLVLRCADRLGVDPTTLGL